jgi:hypothetical protein
MALDPIIYGGDNAYDEAGDGDAVLLLQPLAPKLEWPLLQAQETLEQPSTTMLTLFSK